MTLEQRPGITHQEEPGVSVYGVRSDHYRISGRESNPLGEVNVYYYKDSDTRVVQWQNPNSTSPFDYLTLAQKLADDLRDRYEPPTAKWTGLILQTSNPNNAFISMDMDRFTTPDGLDENTLILAVLYLPEARFSWDMENHLVVVPLINAPDAIADFVSQNSTSEINRELLIEVLTELGKEKIARPVIND